MLRSCIYSSCVLLYILSDLPLNHGHPLERRVLEVGKELWKEHLPLGMGSCLYQLQGLKSNTWYEVKISYPASIPASFSLHLKRGNSGPGLNRQRKLLNTEKLIFKSNTEDFLSNQGESETYVLVTVEPAGVVAIPQRRERQDVIFNIVCDELLLGIPHKAWLVVILVVICLGLAFVIPSLLPSYLLHKNLSPQSAHQIVSKDS
ncbi:hypothetical protein RJ639_013590 [Escallonia herrerae]|uniref:Uncharacterized protein n=1 Tax=Escallonia herrerae TaxID=1293975 RepID=A0AA89AP13_9ASTE|nr:hypothetical protein RJ639_013590 [Escallonia herrerae]